MSSRGQAWALVFVLATVLLFLLVVETARGTDRQELAAARAVRAEFGTGSLAGCFLAIADRETGHTFNPRAANLRDRHADGSVGSFGLFQIGALWRRTGEAVAAFQRRMYDPATAAATAHRIYRLHGLKPWGNRCA